MLVKSGWIGLTRDLHIPQMGLVVVFDNAPVPIGVQGIFEFPKGVTVQVLAYRASCQYASP